MEKPNVGDAEMVKALELSFWVEDQIVNLIEGSVLPKLPYDKRVQISAGFFNLTFYESRALRILVKNQAYEGVFCLMRSVIESYCRGRWVKRVAEDAKIQDLFGSSLKDSGKEFPSMRSLFQTLSESAMKGFSEFQGEELSSTKAKEIRDHYEGIYGLVNDFSHGGRLMVGAQLSEEGLASNHELGLIRELLVFSDVMCLASVAELLDFVQYEGDESFTGLNSVSGEGKEQAGPDQFQADLRRIMELSREVTGLLKS